MPSPEQLANLRTIASAAVASEKATGLPAAFTAAQCIYESQWLARCPGNNAFGIKVDHRGAGVQYFITSEFINGSWVKMPLAFEKYDSLADCFNDHGRLITEGRPYKEAWAQFLQDGNVDAMVQRVGHIYGTDPKYPAKILDMMRSSVVKQAIDEARAA